MTHLIYMNLNEPIDKWLPINLIAFISSILQNILYLWWKAIIMKISVINNGICSLYYLMIIVSLRNSGFKKGRLWWIWPTYGIGGNKIENKCDLTKLGVEMSMTKHVIGGDWSEYLQTRRFGGGEKNVKLVQPNTLNKREKVSVEINVTEYDLRKV